MQAFVDWSWFRSRVDFSRCAKLSRCPFSASRIEASPRLYFMKQRSEGRIQSKLFVLVTGIQNRVVLLLYILCTSARKVNVHALNQSPAQIKGGPSYLDPQMHRFILVFLPWYQASASKNSTFLGCFLAKEHPFSLENSNKTSIMMFTW